MSSALLVAELAALEKARGRTLLDRLADLEERFGRHETRQLSYRVRRPVAHRRRRRRPARARRPRRTGRSPSRRSSSRPTTCWCTGSPAGGSSCGPSGTEPKLKAYLELVDPPAGAMDALAAGGRRPARPLASVAVTWTRETLARTVDHTLLKPEATVGPGGGARRGGRRARRVLDLRVAEPAAGDGRRRAWSSARSSASRPARTRARSRPPRRRSPSRAARPRSTWSSTSGSALAGDWGAVEADVAAVRAACGPALLKVILESAALTPEQLAEACRRSEAGGAQYVKTSTGFHPTGGASVEAVRLMRETVGDRLGVKASGGIRDTATALAMLEAGASRLGPVRHPRGARRAASASGSERGSRADGGARHPYGRTTPMTATLLSAAADLTHVRPVRPVRRPGLLPRRPRRRRAAVLRPPRP